ncbi:hypothetical protein JCM3774_001966 [Rhodotorula dairenensis]
MDPNQLYDPPPSRSSASRGRSSSVSATGAAPRVFQADTARRQSFSASSAPGRPTFPSSSLSDDDAEYRAPPIELTPNPTRARSASFSGPSAQDPADASADRALWRDGRQSKQQMVEDDPNLKMTGDFEQFMAQLYDLTHSIDAVENDVDQIVELRNKIVSLDPKVDVGQVSLKADLDALAALTTQTGRGIVAIEDWLLSLRDWSKKVKAMVKAGQTGETLEEVAEIKYHIATAKMDFAAAMERIREGAQQEAFRRERTRIWMARHIRHREPDIEDSDVRKLLKAAELGSADGIQECPVTSYAGLFALQNPFTELAELTDGMAFLGDTLDTEIVNSATGKDRQKRVIYLNSRSKDRIKEKKSSAPAPAPSWFGSRSTFLSSLRGNAATDGNQGDEYERKFRYIQAEQFAAEKDLEYGFARQAQLNRVNRRKKIIIFLLLVIILALILFIVLATMPIPKPKQGTSTFPLADGPIVSSTAAKATQPLPPQETYSPIASIQSESDAKVPILTFSDMASESPLSLAAEAAHSVLHSAESEVGSFLSGFAPAVAEEITSPAHTLTAAIPTPTYNNGMWAPTTPVGVGPEAQQPAIQSPVPFATLSPGQQPPLVPQPVTASVQQPAPWWAGPVA